jgi:hypothetical protein
MKNIFIAVLMSIFASLTYAESSTPENKKLDSLIVYGQDFMFSVKEPVGWTGDTKNAEIYSSNIIFYPTSQIVDNKKTVIRVLVTDKTDENVQEDMNHDMSQYRTKYAKIQFEELLISHPKYKVFPKLFSLPSVFYEYVTYVNPGPQMKMMFSVSMNKQINAATKDELDAYQKVIASLFMLKNNH